MGYDCARLGTRVDRLQQGYGVDSVGLDRETAIQKNRLAGQRANTTRNIKAEMSTARVDDFDVFRC